jgi:hypothetical protein
MRPLTVRDIGRRSSRNGGLRGFVICDPSQPADLDPLTDQRPCTFAGLLETEWMSKMVPAPVILPLLMFSVALYVAAWRGRPTKIRQGV